ncbi:MAG: PilZ domain-containing protein [Candidatus Krumholzibacteria bacterium]|jgi:hypothetical protein|nr:PilZ domain-containing protein [Candidatus Krumholzibacteria bacterium]MDP6669352.1 PilZ domain-containing protein [Candidatus Krumholzibacteria bacterium]MDP6796233.1 PilZ domain-containing protein [Candidatus Krumholzibacteria bacterium]MDP7020985.1 PilZ domain-containing protein [Candidatus Krumholzibacteria bacterium]
MEERRRARRLDISLKLEIRLEPGSTSDLGRTLNLSSSGVYFDSPYHMEEGTKLPLTLHLPEEDEQSNPWVLRQDGIVVRCEPEEEDPAVSSYRIACFFYSIEEEERDRLEDYISSRTA